MILRPAQSTTWSNGPPVCIPARWASSRFEGKLLAELPNGRSVLETSIAIAKAAQIGPVWLLAGDERIAQAAEDWDVSVHRSTRPALNGSERIAWAIEEGLFGVDLEFIINLQGDAVGAHPSLLEAALEALMRHPEAGLGTVAVRAPVEQHRGQTTVRAEGGLALDFSRAALPAGEDSVLLHLGIYAYRVPSLLQIASREPTPRERAESLEQLRWLESGETVALAVVDGAASLADAVDRPADLQSARIHEGNNAPSQGIDRLGCVSFDPVVHQDPGIAVLL
ncbi:MAG: NTP transferase domain-containing protein [Myxococcota bacterium]|nr:NTP transferase domain-containing protein [Myxococcota bacterium]